jgi:hypothetical protein
MILLVKYLERDQMGNFYVSCSCLGSLHGFHLEEGPAKVYTRWLQLCICPFVRDGFEDWVQLELLAYMYFLQHRSLGCVKE